MAAPASTDGRLECDPTRIVQQAFDMGVDFRGPAEDVLLSWMLSLGGTTDATRAATELVAAYQPRVEVPGVNPLLLKLHRLLTEVSRARPTEKPTRRRTERRAHARSTPAR